MEGTTVSDEEQAREREFKDLRLLFGAVARKARDVLLARR